MAEGVRLKSYVDAVNAETRRTNAVVAWGLIGTGAALIFGILQAVRVSAASTDKLFSLHNDLIRSGERKAAELSATMATKTELEPLKSFVEAERGGAAANTRFWGALVIVGTFALAIGFGLANLIGV